MSDIVWIEDDPSLLAQSSPSAELHKSNLAAKVIPVEEDLLTAKNRDKKRKVTCRVCFEKEGVYRCPECDIRTCSVQCVKAHKNDSNSGCQGKRKIIESRNVKEMNDRDLLNDFSFLNEVGTVIESSARIDNLLSLDALGLPRPKIATNLPSPAGKSHLSVALFRNLARANQVRLKLAPPGFSKRVQNTTTVSNNKNTRKLRWRIQWILQAETDSKELLQSEYIDKSVSCDRDGISLVSRFQSEAIPFKGNDALREIFKSAAELTLLTPEEDGPVNDRGYLLLPQNDCNLKKWLAGLFIIEFPTFVVLPSHQLNVSPPLDNNSNGEVTDGPPATEISSPLFGDDKGETLSRRPRVNLRGSYVGEWRGKRVYRKIFRDQYFLEEHRDNSQVDEDAVGTISTEDILPQSQFMEQKT